MHIRGQLAISLYYRDIGISNLTVAKTNSCLFFQNLLLSTIIHISANDEEWDTVSSSISDVDEFEVPVGYSIQIFNKGLKIHVSSF